jgi:hypothetical protein|tara:strand:+ start:917 stop:1327 length:411 start_codon:yes stop_codon:yes gene_type:complete
MKQSEPTINFNSPYLLRSIVNKVCRVNVLSKKRNREIVNARMIYSKILRDRKYSYVDIGMSLLKNHASVIHYCKSVNWLLKYDNNLQIKYEKCLELFSCKDEEIQNLSKPELIIMVKKLENTNKLLSLEVSRLSID